jgi:hypothetical protein
VVFFALDRAAGFSAAGFSAAGFFSAAAPTTTVSTAGSLGTVIWSVCSSVLMGSRDSWHLALDAGALHAGEMPYE